MKSFKLFGYVVVMGLALTGSLAQAGTLTVPTMFSNNAVLQRGMAVPVFGTATAGASVTVTLFSATSPPNTIRTKTTTAAADGKWQVKLEAMEALTGNNTLVISSSGATTITRTGIQVGEVWVGSGQSNMSRDLTFDTDYARATASAASYNLHFFNVTANGSPASTVWQVSNATTASSFSATLFFFGRYLAEQMPGVPIGLISAARSATAIDTWSTAVGSGSNYTTMVKPLQPYAIRGVSWYQGEWDARSAGAAQNYYYKLPMLIQQWRNDWAEGSFPFYIVQMPRMGLNYIHIIRDAELYTGMTVPDTAISTHIDYPVVDVHPPAKETIGRRQALLALKNVYGYFIEESGPIANLCKSYVNGSKVIVGFDHIGSGLSTGGSSLGAWQLASAPGGAYANATAQIVDNAVVVSSSSVPNPACVRYAFARAPADPATFLFNTGAGRDNEMLATSPIREMCLPVASTKMHVAEIVTTSASFTAPARIDYGVQVVDQNLSAVSGATVSTALIQPTAKPWTTGSAISGADGWALFSQASTKAPMKGTYTINITNLTRSGVSYDPCANIASSTTFTLK